MKVYRKRETSDTWHWREDCSIWPTKDYTERKTKPKSGELCNQCAAKDRKDAEK